MADNEDAGLYDDLEVAAGQEQSTFGTTQQEEHQQHEQSSDQQQQPELSITKQQQQQQQPAPQQESKPNDTQAQQPQPEGDSTVPPDNARRLPDRLFFGGLMWDTTTDGLKMYFEQFGEVASVEIMHDRLSGRSRGFGFVRFVELEAQEKCLQVKDHFIDGKRVDLRIDEGPQHHAPVMMMNGGPNTTTTTQIPSSSPQAAATNGTAPVASSPPTSTDGNAVPTPTPAVPNLPRKVFIGGLMQETREADLRAMMIQYGEIAECSILLDRNTGRSRGFGFVTYVLPSDAERATQQQWQMLQGKQVEVKFYSPGTGGMHNNFGHFPNGGFGVGPRPMMFPRPHFMGPQAHMMMRGPFPQQQPQSQPQQQQPFRGPPNNTPWAAGSATAPVANPGQQPFRPPFRPYFRGPMMRGPGFVGGPGAGIPPRGGGFQNGVANNVQNARFRPF